MKKLFLIAAFGLLASPAFAQNTAVTTQTGDDHKVDVLQTGTQHEAYVTQISDGQFEGATADVGQSGTSQYAEVLQSSDPRRAYAEVRQDDGSGSGDNAAYISQLRSQDDSWAYIHQSGTTNTGTIFQDAGGRNRAQIHQGQTDDSSIDNEATIIQDFTGGGTSAYMTLAEVSQDGTSNEATVNQSLSQNAFASVDQDGSDNWANVRQYNPVDLDPNHSATVVQDGDLNQAQVLQQGRSDARNLASVEQGGGDSNVAFLDQDGDGGSHTMAVTQTGNSNQAGVAGDALFQAGMSHSLTVMQTGNFNVASSVQTGDMHSASIMQSGGQNTANVQQGN